MTTPSPFQRLIEAKARLEGELANGSLEDIWNAWTDYDEAAMNSPDSDYDDLLERTNDALTGWERP